MQRSAAEVALVEADKTLRSLEGFLADGAQQQLVDFDCHLDDASKDWLNTRLFAGC